MRRKKRGERVTEKDRNQVCGVHNGKTYVKRQLVNPMYVGLKWGERAKTRKPCRKGADRNLKARMQVMKKSVPKTPLSIFLNVPRNTNSSYRKTEMLRLLNSKWKRPAYGMRKVP